MVEVIDSNISYLPFPTFTGDGLAVWFDSNISYLSFPTFTGDGLTVLDSLTFIFASLFVADWSRFKVALRTLL